MRFRLYRQLRLTQEHSHQLWRMKAEGGECWTVVWLHTMGNLGSCLNAAEDPLSWGGSLILQPCAARSPTAGRLSTLRAGLGKRTGCLAEGTVPFLRKRRNAACKRAESPAIFLWERYSFFCKRESLMFWFSFFFVMQVNRIWWSTFCKYYGEGHFSTSWVFASFSLAFFGSWWLEMTLCSSARKAFDSSD